MKLKWKLILVGLEIVLILTLDGCMVCNECTIGSKSHFLIEHLGDKAQEEARLIHLEIVLVSVQYRCMVCAKRTICSEIVLDAPDETPR